MDQWPDCWLVFEVHVLLDELLYVVFALRSGSAVLGLLLLICLLLFCILPEEFLEHQLLRKHKLLEEGLLSCVVDGVGLFLLEDHRGDNEIVLAKLLLEGFLLCLDPQEVFNDVSWLVSGQVSERSSKDCVDKASLVSVSLFAIRSPPINRVVKPLSNLPNAFDFPFFMLYLRLARRVICKSHLAHPLNIQKLYPFADATVSLPPQICCRRGLVPDLAQDLLSMLKKDHSLAPLDLVILVALSYLLFSVVDEA